MENGESKTVLNVAHKSVQMLLVEYTTSKDKIDVEDNEQKEDDNESKEKDPISNNTHGSLNTNKNIKLKKSKKENITKEFNLSLILDSFKTDINEGDYTITMGVIRGMPYERIAHQKVDTNKNTIFHLAAKESKLNALLALLDYLEEELSLKNKNNQFVWESIKKILLQKNSARKTVFQIASEDRMFGKNILEVFEYYTKPHQIEKKNKIETIKKVFGGEDNRYNKVELLNDNNHQDRSYLKSGLNIGAICKKNSCKNSKKIFWINLGYGNWNIQIKSITCPLCNDLGLKEQVVIYKADYCYAMMLLTELTNDGYQPIIESSNDYNVRQNYKEKWVRGGKVKCEYADESHFKKHFPMARGIFFKVRKWGTLKNNKIFY